MSFVIASTDGVGLPLRQKILQPELALFVVVPAAAVGWSRLEDHRRLVRRRVKAGQGHALD